MTPLTAGQTAILERIQAVLTQDERIISAWLSGSVGRGEGDAWSDIDVTCVVEEEDLSACVGEYGGRRNPVGETVHQLIVYGRVAANISPEWVRYDLSFVTPAEFRHQDTAKLRPLVRATRPPTGRTKEIQMDGARLVAVATEFLRVLGLLPVAVGRHEWLVGIEGEALLCKMTVDLMVEANGRTGDRGGVKRLNAFLTRQQQADLEALVTVAPSREGLIGASVGMARLFLPLAKGLIAQAGGTWPQAFEDATLAHLQRELAIAI